MFSAHRSMRSHYVRAVRALMPYISHRPWNTRVHHPGAMALIEVEDVMQQLERVLRKENDFDFGIKPVIPAQAEIQNNIRA